MKTNTKTDTREAELTPRLIEAYRTYPTSWLRDSLHGMPAFLDHATAFQAVGALDRAVAAERAWVADACLLAAEQTNTTAEASEKIATLRSGLERQAWLIDECRTAWVVIAAAVEHERRRWGIDAATRH